MGIKHKPCEYDKFFGKWTTNLDGKSISIEFGSGGTFNCFSKNNLHQKMLLLSEEYDQKFSLINKTKISPSWDLKKGKLVIILTTKEQSFNYSFNKGDSVLELTKGGTKEKLSFSKDLDGKSVSSLVPWVFKINILFAFLFFVILFSLVVFSFEIGSILNLSSMNLIIFILASIVTTVISLLYMRSRLIKSKIKSIAK